MKHTHPLHPPPVQSSSWLWLEKVENERECPFQGVSDGGGSAGGGSGRKEMGHVPVSWGTGLERATLNTRLVHLRYKIGSARALQNAL